MPKNPRKVNPRNGVVYLGARFELIIHTLTRHYRMVLRSICWIERCTTGSRMQTTRRQLSTTYLLQPPLPQSRWKDPRTPRPAGGGSRMLRGLMLRMKNFCVGFLMFSKYLWRYSCIMKSTRELEAPRQARSRGPGVGVRWVHKHPPPRPNGPPCWVPVLLSAQERAGTWLSLKSML